MKIAPFAVPVLVLLAACTASPDPVSTPPEPAGTANGAIFMGKLLGSR
jgi:hypothetical protein